MTNKTQNWLKVDESLTQMNKTELLSSIFFKVLQIKAEQFASNSRFRIPIIKFKHLYDSFKFSAKLWSQSPEHRNQTLQSTAATTTAASITSIWTTHSAHSTHSTHSSHSAHSTHSWVWAHVTHARSTGGAVQLFQCIDITWTEIGQRILTAAAIWVWRSCWRLWWWAIHSEATASIRRLTAISSIRWCLWCGSAIWTHSVRTHWLTIRLSITAIRLSVRTRHLLTHIWAVLWLRCCGRRIWLRSGRTGDGWLTIRRRYGTWHGLHAWSNGCYGRRTVWALTILRDIARVSLIWHLSISGWTTIRGSRTITTIRTLSIRTVRSWKWWRALLWALVGLEYNLEVVESSKIVIERQMHSISDLIWNERSHANLLT